MWAFSVDGAGGGVRERGANIRIRVFWVRLGRVRLGCAMLVGSPGCVAARRRLRGCRGGESEFVVTGRRLRRGRGGVNVEQS